MERMMVLAEEIREELEGAADYARKAAHCREKDAVSAAIYGKMAEDELRHAEDLHKIGQHELERDGGDAGEMRLWDWEKKMLHDRMGRIRRMMD